jgi:hypothetical protein
MRPTPEASPAEEPASRAFTLVTTVVAPLSMIVALLTYFGWTRTGAIYGYFGVDQSIFGLSVQDYLIRSGQAVFQPLAAAVVFAVLAMLVDQVAALVVAGHVRVVRWVLVGSGFVLGAVGLNGAVQGPDPFGIDPLVSAVSLCAGTTLLAVAVKNCPPPGLSRLTAAVLVLVGLLTSVFWATAVYASRTGTQVAQQVDRNPEGRTAVTVLSEKALDLGAALVQTRVEPAEGEFRYRYQGARLLAYANQRWVLITGRAPSGRLQLLILPDGDSISVLVGS